MQLDALCEKPLCEMSELDSPHPHAVAVSHSRPRALASGGCRLRSPTTGCDDEFCAVSDAINAHGRDSEPFKAAAERLKACQGRRARQMAAIEGRCGPAQEAFRRCVQDTNEKKGPGQEHECLPVLHSFLDCADIALG